MGALATRAVVVALGLWPAAGAGCYRPAVLPDSPAEQLAWVRRFQAPAGPAPDATPCPGHLDDAEVARLARDASAEVQARLVEAHALEGLAEVSLADAPELRLSELRLDRLLAGPARAELALRVPIERPGTLDARADAVRHAAAMARAEAAEVGREVARDARLSFARWVVANERVALAEQTVALAETGRARVAEARRRGEADDAELLTAELVHTAARGDLALARSEVTRWWAALAARIGLTPGCAPSPSAPDWVAEARSLMETPELEALALSRRPALGRLAAELARAEARAHEARAATWPWLAWVQVGYEVVSPAAADTWGFALSLELPVGTWDGAGIEAAEAERSGLERAARATVGEVAREVAAARGEVEGQLGVLAQLEALASSALRARLEPLRAAARIGQADADAVMDLERDLLRLERRGLDARLALAEALVGLRAALGEPP